MQMNGAEQGTKMRGRERGTEDTNNSWMWPQIG